MDAVEVSEVVARPREEVFAYLADVANLSEKVFVFVFLFFVGLSLITAAAVWVRGRLKRAAARRNPEPGAK